MILCILRVGPIIFSKMYYFYVIIIISYEYGCFEFIIEYARII